MRNATVHKIICKQNFTNPRNEVRTLTKLNQYSFYMIILPNRGQKRKAQSAPNSSFSCIVAYRYHCNNLNTPQIDQIPLFKTTMKYLLVLQLLIPPPPQITAVRVDLLSPLSFCVSNFPKRVLVLLRTTCTRFRSGGGCAEISTVELGVRKFPPGLNISMSLSARRSLSASNLGQSFTRCLIDLLPWPHGHITGAVVVRGVRSFAMELLLRFPIWEDGAGSGIVEKTRGPPRE